MRRNKALLIMALAALVGGFVISEIISIEAPARRGCPFGQVHRIDHDGRSACVFG